MTISTKTEPISTTITIPRHADESARAYAARVAYVTMGPQRSLDAVAQKSAKSLPLMKRWSVAHDWQATARAWDDQQAAAIAAEAAAAYRADLEEHRKRYQQSGKALHGVAVEMLTQLRQSARTIEYTPAALATISRALTVAADLEAHALRLGELLPKLSGDGDAEL